MQRILEAGSAPGLLTYLRFAFQPMNRRLNSPIGRVRAQAENRFQSTRWRSSKRSAKAASCFGRFRLMIGKPIRQPDPAGKRLELSVDASRADAASE